MYIFFERGDQELSKTVSIMFVRHFWNILQYLEVLGVFSGIEYCCFFMVGFEKTEDLFSKRIPKLGVWTRALSARWSAHAYFCLVDSQDILQSYTDV